MVRKFPRNVFRKFEIVEFKEMPTLQPKIIEIPRVKLNGIKTYRKKFRTVVSLAIIGSCWKLKPDVLVEWKALKKIGTKAFTR